MTAEDLRLPDDGFRYELVRGELRKMPPADTNTARLRQAYHSTDQHVSAHRLGVVRAELASGSVLTRYCTGAMWSFAASGPRPWAT
jgi:hypothetical protein